jgi:translocation and assembly module TamB
MSEAENMSEKKLVRRVMPWVVAAVLMLAIPVAIIVFLWSGVPDRYLRALTIRELAKATGGQVELGGFHLNPGSLRVTLDNLTIHGREMPGAPPFFHADSLVVGLRVDSFWGRKFSVGDVEVMHPSVHIQVNRDGSTNVPSPAGPRNGKPIRERIFELVVHRLRLDDGEMVFNDTSVPLVAEGGRLDLAVDYSKVENKGMYLGNFTWQGVELSAKHYLPFSSDLMVRFTFEPDSIEVTQLILTLPHTTLDTQFSLSDFVHPTWNFRYRGHLDLRDLRAVLRKPKVPSGRVEFNGAGNMADGNVEVNGGYSAIEITLRDPWFHSAGMSSRGSYHADRDHLEVPDFSAAGLGGGITGRVQLQFHGLLFHVDAHAQGMSLATVLAAVNNSSFPVTPLHWNGAMDVQSVLTWTADFKQLDATGVSLWTPPAQLRKGEIPITARINFHYSMAQEGVTLTASEIDTPDSSVKMDGMLAGHKSDIAVVFDTKDLLPWDDFINRLRGPTAEPKLVAGGAHWQGRISGPIVGPSFIGHMKGTDARYDQLFWDEMEGDMTYSPDGFALVHASARRGRSSAQLEMALTLDDWSFTNASPWTFDATLVRTDTSGLQALLGVPFSIGGLLSGEFHGTGTRSDPTMSGLFDMISPEAWGWKFDRARGEFSLRHGAVRVSNFELRILPPATSGTSASANSAAPGLLTGNFLYGTLDHQVIFDLTGAAVPLDGIAQIQTPRLAIGGRLSFQLAGQGSLLAPKLQGSLRLVDLRLGSDTVGSFQGRVDSDGEKLNLMVDSAMSTGSLHGAIQLSLGGDYPVTSSFDLAQIDLDPLLAAALHVTAITGHGQADGHIAVSGALLRPETLNVSADLSHLAFDFEYVKLENVGPVRLQYDHSGIRIDQANLRGMDTDFKLSGFARFTGDRALGLQLGGQVNLSLFEAFVPNLTANGPAQVDAAIAGTLANPRITGRVHVQGATLRFGDFPTGLSQVAGDFVFNANRLVFDNVAAQAGGGALQLSGSVSYGGGPFHYDLTAHSDQIRIRYPIGMSWLTGGTLQLSGSSQAATLSGQVTVDRLLMSESFDPVSLLGSSSDAISGPSTNSTFLRNLQFDVQAVSSPNARLEWSSGSSQTEASLRIRGTWEHPILLGNIHMLSGDMQFRGNQYRLSRGDINFVNPFRLDPVVDIEAITTIRQYQVTVDFDGPASHLTMSYRSDPPLPSSDIITLLALGSTGEESQLRGATAVQTPEVGATTLLSEAISSQLGGRVQRLFGISHFSVDPSYLSTTAVGTNPGARVTIEQQFARNLTITYSTDVTSTQEQVIQIEYAVRPDLSVVALRDENGTFGIDVIRKNRFK